MKLTREYHTAQLSGLLTKELLCGMMEHRTYFTFDRLFLCPAAFIYRGLGSVKDQDLTPINDSYTGRVYRMPLVTKAGPG